MRTASTWSVTSSLLGDGIAIHQVVDVASMMHGYDVVIPDQPTVRVLCRGDDHQDGKTLGALIREGLAVCGRDYDGLSRHLHNGLVKAQLVWCYVKEAADDG